MANETSGETKTQEQKNGGIPKWLIIVGVVLVFIIAGLGVSGYVASKIAGKIVRTVIQKQTGADINVDNNGGTIKVQDKTGAMEVGTTAKWPEDLPAEVPKFTGGTVAASIKNNQNGQKAWSVILKDVTKESVDSYVNELKGSGWEVTTEVVTVVEMTQLQKGNFLVSLTYDPNSKGVTFTVEDKGTTE